jgi:type IV secretory pathway VirB4 component
MRRMWEQVGWKSFEAPATVALWNGGYMRTCGYRGPDITSASRSDRIQLCERISSATRLAGSTWAWHIEGQNVEIKGYPKSQWPTTASRLLDAEREAACAENGSQYEMQSFLSLTQSMPMFAPVHNQSARDRQRDKFRRASDEVIHALRGVFSIDDMDDDDVASYLKSTVSSKRQRVRAADHDNLGESLADERFVRGFELSNLRDGLGMSRLGKSYVSVLTLGGFPSKTHPQLLSDLSRLPFEFRWVTRWVGMSRLEAKRHMASRELHHSGSSRYFRDIAMSSFESMTSGNPKKEPSRTDREAVKLAENAGAEMERLGEREYGSLSTIFVVLHANKRVCVENTALLKSALQVNDMVVREERWEPVRPWRMSLPGNMELGLRCFPVTSRNLADLMPTTSVWQGTNFDRQLAKSTGVQRPWMYTADPVPFRIGTDVPGGAAHTLLLGATGSAKSTFANHLAMQFLGWPDAQIISFSVGRSELGPVLLNGGAVYSPGSRASLQWQPLAHVDEPMARVQALEWLQVCLRARDEPVTSERTEALGDALQRLATDDIHRRTMTALVAYLQTRAPGLALALKEFTHAGSYGHIFDGDDVAALQRTRWTMFDLSTLLNLSRTAVIPALHHLVHSVARWFDGRPTLLQCDECQEWLHHEPLEKFASNTLDAQRKNNVRALMIAPTPGKFSNFPNLLKSIKSGCVTKIYGADAQARSQAADYEAFGVNPVEVELISKIPLGSFLLKNSHGSRQFATRMGPIALALTGMSSREELAMLADLRARCSSGDEMLIELLKHTKLTKRAMELKAWKTKQQQQPRRATQVRVSTATVPDAVGDVRVSS